MKENIKTMKYESIYNPADGGVEAHPLPLKSETHMRCTYNNIMESQRWYSGARRQRAHNKTAEWP